MRTSSRALCGFAVILACACGGSGSNGSGTIGSGGPSADGGAAGDAGSTVPGLASISLSQTDVHIPAGASTAFAVTAAYEDGTRGDVTPQAKATSSDAAVASVSSGPGSQIQIHALAEGAATIVVSYGGLQQRCAVTVTPRR